MLKKVDLVERYAQEMKCSKKDATVVIDKVIDLIKTGVIKDGGVDLYGFMRVEKVHKEAGTARSPKTGETVEVPAKHVPKAKFSAAFKREVNI